MPSPEQFAAAIDRIRESVHQTFLGQDEVLDLVLAAVFGSGHVLVEGVPGLGKTLLVRTLAKSLGLSFGRIQFTPDLMPSDVTGTAILVDAPGGDKRFRFAPGPLFANLVLADEVNRATPKTQSALLEAMQERQVTVLGETHRLHEPFLVLATQNPVEMEGTYPLPEAQLDRFLFKILIPFPIEQELTAILAHDHASREDDIPGVIDAATVQAWRTEVMQLPAPDFAVQLAARLVLNTHAAHPGAPDAVRRYVRFGASPRAGQAMLMGARFRALRSGRTHVSRDDVLAYALPSLRHRLVLNFEAAADRVSADDVIARVLEATPRETA